MNQQPDNPTAELQLRAERKLGQLIPEQFPKGGPKGNQHKKVPKSQAATMADSGISRTQSSRWQKVADVPDPEFQEYVAAERAKGGKRLRVSQRATLEDSGISRTQSSRWQGKKKEQMSQPATLADSGISRTPTQGPPMSRHRSTAAKLAARVDAVSQMLAQRMTRTQIHREAERLWGCGWQAADRYARHARENALRTLGQTREDAIAESFAFLASVIRNPDAEVRDKLVANRDIGELLGLYPPKAARLKGTGPDGDALTIVTVIAESPPCAGHQGMQA